MGTGRSSRAHESNSNQKIIMIRYALIFLVIAMIAEALGLGGVAGEAAWIAHVLFVIFLVLFIVSLVFRGGRPPVAGGLVKRDWWKGVGRKPPRPEGRPRLTNGP